MAICLDSEKTTPNYQTLFKKSGLSLLDFDVFLSNYLDVHLGLYPELREIPGANSLSYILKVFNKRKLKDNSYIDVTFKLLQEIYNTTDTKEILMKLNLEYSDKEINVIPLVESCLIKITDKPSIFKYRNTINDTLTLTYKLKITDNAAVINNIVDRLADLYNIDIKFVTTSVLKENPDFKEVVTDKPENIKAFILNGNIYINTSNFSADSPIHEMLHLLLGSMKFTNPDLYVGLVESLSSTPEYGRFRQDFKTRSELDLKEEFLVTEFSKYLASDHSIFESKDLKEIKSNIFEHIYNVLDVAINGEISVKTVPINKLLNNPLSEIGKLVDSKNFSNYNIGTFNKFSAELNRKINNFKSDLIKNNKLKYICE